jgi:NADH:ubiquinone oxidoreductase subunit 5 (subunit L)/multisubunit Na+/H+ antiporter MnhA subunit
MSTIEKLDRASLFDRAWEGIYRGVLLRISGVLGWIDRYVVDGLMNGVGWTTLESGSAVRPLQTGLVRDYALAVVVGVIVLAVIGAWG